MCFPRDAQTTSHEIFSPDFPIGEPDYYLFDNVALCSSNGCNDGPKATFCRDAGAGGESDGQGSGVGAVSFGGASLSMVVATVTVFALHSS